MKMPDLKIITVTSLTDRHTISEWAKTRYRSRVFNKDETIPVRQGLLYLVNEGVVRLTGSSAPSVFQEQDEINDSGEIDSSSVNLTENEEISETFLGFVSCGQPFEVISDARFSLQAQAHVENTEIIWLYWQDMDIWPDLRRQVYDMLRYQHLRKLLWVSALGQRKTIDRLMSFFTLLIEEYGEPCEEGYYLPYPLTHAQIGNSIGSTRVTVTRLVGELRRQGKLKVMADNSLCLPAN